MRSKYRSEEGAPALRFTAYAWAKFRWLCLRGPSEIGAFGISDPEDLLLIVDVALVKQEASFADVRFIDEAVADYFDEQVDQGRLPAHFARIWLHTHPGDCPIPSSQDEETFSKAFGNCDWAVMAILARGGQTYARLRFNIGPGGQVDLSMAVSFERPFAGSDHAAWEAAYKSLVEILQPVRRQRLLDPEDGLALVPDTEREFRLWEWPEAWEDTEL